jgi:hypothetical protein
MDSIVLYLLYMGLETIVARQYIPLHYGGLCACWASNEVSSVVNS